MRIMAIDYGTKRVGIAVTDPDQIIAQPLETVGSHELFPFLKAYIAKDPIQTLVVGQSLNHNGEINPVQNQIDAFVIAFQKRFPKIQIHEMDERLSSKLAENAIAEMRLTKKKRRDKGLIDKVSAAILLNDYLNFHK